MKLDTSLPPLHCTQAAHSLKLLDFRNSPEKPDRLEPAELSARQWRKSDPVMPQRHKSFCGLHWLHGFTCLLLAESLLAHVCCPRFLHPKSLDLAGNSWLKCKILSRTLPWNTCGANPSTAFYNLQSTAAVFFQSAAGSRK